MCASFVVCSFEVQRRHNAKFVFGHFCEEEVSALHCRDYITHHRTALRAANVYVKANGEPTAATGPSIGQPSIQSIDMPTMRGQEAAITSVANSLQRHGQPSIEAEVQP